MNAAATTHQHTNCLRCGRRLTSAKSCAAGYGPTCAAKVRRSAVDLADYKPHQVQSARELIEDGAIIPLRSVVFIAVSTDGTETYKSAPTGCTCPAGLKGSRCYHQLAVRMLLAA
jgi:ribosomal protein L37E